MDTTELFLASDAALRSVIDRVTPAGFDALNDAATEAVRAGVGPESTFRFHYGDFPARGRTERCPSFL